MRSICCVALCLLIGVTPCSAEPKTPRNEIALLKKYCESCHGPDGDSVGEFDLARFEQNARQTADAEIVRRVLDVIRDAEMPPEDVPAPDSGERSRLLESLESRLHETLRNDSSSKLAPIRRMNRFQYNNAVTDLFQLNCVVFTLPERMLREHQNYFQPASGEMAQTVRVGSRPLGKSQLIEPRLAGVTPFPQDLRAEHGYDNQADHLSLSPLLMDSFLKLSQSITHSPDFGPNRVGIWNAFFAKPRSQVDLSSEVSKRLKFFLTSAFRRNVDEHVLARYHRFVMGQLEQDVDFVDAMKAVASAVIASPKFLYLYDDYSGDESPSSDDDFQLASRLSFFLWGSIPDQELMDLAARGKLDDDEILIDQVERMLRDQRLKRFCDSFPAQWLQLERIISAIPDPDRYPNFYFAKYRNSMHMMCEPLLLFETVLIENQPVTQFIDSDFTYRSLRLRDAYGETVSDEERKQKRGGDVTVLRFDRYPVTDRRFGGLITNAAVMTMTSGAHRTKPITRGAWIASVIFNSPPDPPPADVPPLDEKPPEDEASLTLRERLTLHRQRADCRGCHENIDPLGFVLENYSPIGTWRDAYENGRSIDAAGTLFRVHPFSDVVEFKDAILKEKDRFVEGFAGHVLAFALARELDAADSLAVQSIADKTAADGYRMQTLIKEVVLSEPFRRRR